MKAEEFINHQEIEDTLAYADLHKDDMPLIRAILDKAREGKGLSHREASVLLANEDAGVQAEIAALAREIKEEVLRNRHRHVRAAVSVQLLRQRLRLLPLPPAERPHTAQEADAGGSARRSDRPAGHGHKRLAIEGRRRPGEHPIEYILECIDTIYSIKHKNGAIRRVNVNIAATTVENYRRLKEAGIGTYILFQERTTRRATKSSTPRPQTQLRLPHRGHGPRHGGRHRRRGAGRALRAGTVPLRVRRAADAREHLEAVHGVGPHTISVPRIKRADDIDPSAFDNGISDEIFLKLCALIRVAVPYTGMIISTRESQSVRERAMELGISQISGGSRTSVGGYTRRNGPPTRSSSTCPTSARWTRWCAG